MPAISEPEARPEATGGTSSWTRANSVPATGSTRVGFHCPSAGGGGTAGGVNGTPDGCNCEPGYAGAGYAGSVGGG